MSIMTTQEPKSELLSRLTFDEATVRAAKAIIARDAPDHIIKLVLYRCSQLGCDPMGRMIYAIERKGVWSLQASIDLFRAVAEASTDYAGQIGPFWCGEDGVWVDAWLKKTPPVAAKVGVERTGFKNPLFAVARFDEYAAGGPMWQKMPSTMISKCAEALALRRAFPAKLTGLYTSDEMQQADRGVMPENARVLEPVAVAPVALAPAESAEVPPTINELKELFTEADIRGISLGEWMEKHVAPNLLTRADPITGKRIAPMPVELCVTRRMLREVIDALAPEPPQQPPHDDPVMTAAIIAKAKSEAQQQAQMDFTNATTESVNTEPRTDAQLKKVQIMFRERGMTTEGHRHMFAAALLGEHKRSSKNWTVDDARRMIDRLELIPPRNEAQA